MLSLPHRQLDLAKLAAAIAAAEGWTVVGAGDPGRSAPRAQTHDVSIVVTGGALRGMAVLTVARPQQTGTPRIVSAHLPRVLVAPPIPRRRKPALSVRLVEHPGRGTLEQLLAAGAGLSAGEVATVLAAVARALSDVHSAGWAGVHLSPGGIAFRDDGCPVVTAVHHLDSLDRETMRADLAAFASLAGTVCSAVAGRSGAVVLAAATDRAHRSWEDVIRSVLRSADPVAVRSPPHLTAGVEEGPPARGDPLGAAEHLLELVGDRPLHRALAWAGAWVAARPLVAVVATVPLMAALGVLVVLPGPPATSG